MRVPGVLIVGGGPAGRALAAECGAHGLATTLVDRAPDAPWRATYGAWLDELPAGLPPPAAVARGRVIACTRHDVPRTYAVLDVPALRAHLDGKIADAGVSVVRGRVTGRAGPDVLLADGSRLHADELVDAGGHASPLRRLADHADGRCTASDGRRARLAGPRARAADHSGRGSASDAVRAPLAGPPRRKRGVAAEQTAYGVVVAAATAAPLVEADAALFMDWRPDHGEPGWPTFLYAVPLGGDRVLLEETSLARRPGLPLPVLRRRLVARLARHGVVPPADPPVERVRFPVDSPPHPAPDVLGYGAAAPLVHPATGFSVAEALRLAPAVAAALAEGGVRAARRVVWSPRARAVYRLRRIGLEALLRMPPPTVPDFFETFFALPDRHRDAYLSGRDDLAGTLSAMGALFARADGPLRRRLVGPAFRRSAPALD